MQAHTNFEARQAFVLTGQDIERIWKDLTGHGLTVFATVDCADGLVRHFTSYSDLVSYENPRRAQITGLAIAGGSDKPRQTAEISFGRRFSTPITVLISAEEQIVSTIRRSTTDVLDSIRPWYSRIATSDLFFFWFTVLLISFFVIAAMFPSNAPSSALPFAKALLGTVRVIAVLALIGSTIWGIAWVRKTVFPVRVFAIRDGLNRHQTLEQVRWVVVVGLVVGVVASILATLMLGTY